MKTSCDVAFVSSDGDAESNIESNMMDVIVPPSVDGTGESRVAAPLHRSSDADPLIQIP